MKKKILILTLSVLFCLCSALGLTACGNNGSSDAVEVVIKTDGSVGTKGDKGDKGDKGEQGIQGEQGVQGEKGEQGDQGIQGEKGDKGDQGNGIKEVIFKDGSIIIILEDGTIYTHEYIDEFESFSFVLNANGRGYTLQGRGNVSDRNLVIPETYRGLPVTSIINDAFGMDKNIDSIVIPDSVALIGDGAFAGCVNMKKATVPALAIQYLPTSVQDVTITSGSKIDAQAFKGFSALRSVKLCDSITEIGASAFEGCTALSSINLASVKEIKNDTFNGCKALASVSIPKSITTIGADAFKDCTSIAKVEYAGDVNGWVSIGFANADANPLKYAKKLMIDGEDVKEANVNTATSINAYSLYNAQALETVKIGDNVTSVGEQAFSGCSSLNSFVVSASNTAYSSVAGILYTKDAKTLLAAPANLATATISDGTITIKSEAFRNSTVSSIAIPSSVVTIEDGVFIDAKNLVNVSFDDLSLLNSIGANAFANCSSLQTFGLKEDGLLQTIGAGAFANCVRLRQFSVLLGVNSIGDNAFEGCRSLVEVVDYSLAIEVQKGTAFNGGIGKNAINVYTSAPANNFTVTSDGYVFYNNNGTQLLLYYTGSETELVLPDDSVVGSYEIYDNAFYGNKAITSVVIGDAVTKIGANAFMFCNNLASVALGNNLIEIGSYAFYQCAIESLVIPASVTYIGNYAFMYCYKLAIVEFEDGSVIDTLNAVFYGCYSLTSVEMPSTIATVSSEAFRYCAKLVTIIFDGTQAEWTALGIQDSLANQLGSFTVACTDGDVIVP